MSSLIIVKKRDAAILIFNKSHLSTFNKLTIELKQQLDYAKSIS